MISGSLAIFIKIIKNLKGKVKDKGLTAEIRDSMVLNKFEVNSENCLATIKVPRLLLKKNYFFQMKVNIP